MAWFSVYASVNFDPKHIESHQTQFGMDNTITPEPVIQEDDVTIKT